MVLPYITPYLTFGISNQGLLSTEAITISAHAHHYVIKVTRTSETSANRNRLCGVIYALRQSLSLTLLKLQGVCPTVQ